VDSSPAIPQPLFLFLEAYFLDSDSAEFSVSGFNSQRDFRSDKGKKHSYPSKRKCWNLICHGQLVTNLSINQTKDNIVVMDTVKSFKNPPEMREYWKLHKRKSRTKQKEDLKE
jgi:hypothetical protein